MIHLAREMNIILCGPTTPWTGVGKWVWRGNQMGSGPLRFLSNPQLSMVWYAFTNYRLSWTSDVIPLSMMSCWRFMLGLRANIFLYP